MKKAILLSVLSTFALPVIADGLSNEGEHAGVVRDSQDRGRVHDHNGIEHQPYALETDRLLPENSERMLPVEGFTFWGIEKLPETDAIAPVSEARQANIDTSGVLFNLGKSKVINPQLSELKEVLKGLKEKKNLRLKFIGHTDNTPMSARTRAVYGDNKGLSRARAERAARYFQKELGLDDSSVYWEGRGEEEPITSNATETGKLKNRRVEVEVWYDEPIEHEAAPSVERTSVCRAQPMCKVSVYQQSGNKIRLDNVIEPIRITAPIEFEIASSDIPQSAVQRVSSVMDRLEGYKNVQLVFVGHTDRVPVKKSQTIARYGDNMGLSKARAKEVANYFKDKLGLTDQQVYATGKGYTSPIASNFSRRGRALNRRVELQIWYDKPPQQNTASVDVDFQWCDLVEQDQDEVSEKEIEYVKTAYDKTVTPIRFQRGEHTVDQQYLDYLKKLVNELGGKQNVSFHFIGHTDGDRLSVETATKYKNNQGLSEYRARQVQTFVQQALGLSDDRVSYEGRGASQPLASNNTLKGKARNRRVEVQVYLDQPVESLNKIKTEVEQVRITTDPRDAYGLSPFRITVDGQPLDSNEATHTADVQRCTDVALEKAKVQVQYDNLLLKPRLAVNAWPSVIAYADNPDTGADESLMHFTAYSNYPAYIKKAEVRLFVPGQSTKSEPFAIVPMNQYMKGQWKLEKSLFENSATGDIPSQLIYLVRVYGEELNFDETRPQRLWLREQIAINTEDNNAEQLVSYGENALAVQNIRFDSGTITVNGIDIPEGHKVYVLGHEVPVDKSGRFVAQNIIPEGLHTVEVAVLDERGNGQLFHRDLELPESDWFYVGIADITVGTRDTDGPASTVTQDDRYDDDSFADGRLAFYTKGKTRSDWEITASADTREEPLGDLFKNFADKDPLVLFRRLDSDYYYPTFADDSTLEEGAPTQGKFYMKAQKHKNFGLWGNFESKILDTDLAQVDRALYGAQLHYESKGLTQYGEQKTQLDLFAAEPGTQSAREEFRGTGGSLYFLRHQDITVGSDRIRIEVRDKDTGLVIQRQTLSPGQDYDIDPIQGRVILNSPLSASGADGLLVRDGSIAGNENYLIVTYEFTPGFDDLNELATGGRVSQWLGDHAEIGLTSSKQEVNQTDQKLNAVDLTLRLNPANYIKFEAAQTEGLASEQRESIDGGFGFNDAQPTIGLAPDQKADAGRVETGFQLGKKGRASAFVQKREAGYSAPGQLTTTETDQYGAQADYALTKNVSVNAKYSQREEQLGDQNKALDAGASVDLNEHWKLDAGVRYDDRDNNRTTGPIATDTGERTDLALELAYNSLEKWAAYTFVQGTLDRDNSRDLNNRGGLGGRYQVKDRLKVDGEVSGGNTGTGAKVGTEYQATDRTQLYMAYALENQRSDTGLRGQRGNISGGFKSRYTDNVSVYGEERYAYGDQPTGLTHAYGVDLAPTDTWNIGATAETGKLRNPSGSTIRRLALGLNLGYGHEKIKYAGAIEYRDDKSSGNDRITWLLRNNMTYQNSEDWRTIAKLNWSQSESSQGEFFDGDFTEVIWGYGYRPVDNDRINTLLKYTYFFNKPAPEQVSTRNVNSRFIQRSHILSGDISYDLTRRWTLGGKYAYRLGELAMDRVNPDYFKSRAHLFVLRADWHVIRHWDFLVEGRVLELTDAKDRRSGFLAGLYRHFGKHLKLGLGYNFTDFSDDLTDLSFDSQGVFVNIVGKI